MLAETHEVQALSNRRGAELLSKRLTALIRLEDDVDPLDALQVLGKLLLPVVGAGNAESRDALIPERLSVTLTLDQHHVAGLLDVLKAPQAVELRLASRTPPEPLICLLGLREGHPEAHSFFRAVHAAVGDAHRLLALVLLVPEPVLLEEIYRQALGFGVVLEVAGLHGCSCFGRRRTNLFFVPVALLEEILHLQSESCDDVLRIASGKALEERPAVVSLRDGQARLSVFVRRAESLPRTVRLASTP